MSEILCRLRVDAFASARPVVSWVGVTRRTKTGVIWEERHAVNGRVRTDEKRFPRRDLERVVSKYPGVCEFAWCQDDREPVQGGPGYNMAIVAVLERLRADMARATNNLDELYSLLDAAGIE